ncbi:hypothetical protein B0H19DRAFT_1255868 [Mycena capillaripes]|nr:hypothetical protein B0H19DRAFT_1255868 [Mycena capillaripes]
MFAAMLRNAPPPELALVYPSRYSPPPKCRREGIKIKCCIMAAKKDGPKSSHKPNGSKPNGLKWSACDCCHDRKKKPATNKKKSAVVSSVSEVLEITPVIAPRMRIDRMAKHLSEVERRLADVVSKNCDLHRMVQELRDEVCGASEGSLQLAHFVAGLISFQSGAEEEVLWMRDAMSESWQITEDFGCRADGQGGSGLTTEEKEEMEKKKKHAEVDALADTDGRLEKLNDVEDASKVKEEQRDDEGSWGEDFRRARGCTPPADAEVIVITDLEDEEELVKKIQQKRVVKGKGKRVESDDEEEDPPKGLEDEVDADPETDVELEDAGKQMLEPPIITEDVPKSDD